jgi:hypothetical protein
MYIQATELSGGLVHPEEDVQLTIAVRDLLIKLYSLWEKSSGEQQNELRPVRAIVQASALSSADFTYLEAYAPGMSFALPDGQKIVDLSRLSGLRIPEIQLKSRDLPILRAWHILLLRSTFWGIYHRTYDPVGTLASTSEHTDELWNMLDPLHDGSRPSRLAHNTSLRNAVVYRQILASRSELSDRHPLDALARVCIPGYVERVHRYIQQHRAEIDAMIGLTV